MRKLKKTDFKNPYIIAGIVLAVFFGFATLFPNLFTKASDVLITKSSWPGDYESISRLKGSSGNLELENDHREWWQAPANIDETHNVDVTSTDKNGYFFPAVADIGGGELMTVWSTVDENTTSGELFVQKINSDGSLGGVGWNSGGNQLTSVNSASGIHNQKNLRPQILPINGGAVVFYNFGIGVWAQRIMSDGTAGGDTFGDEWDGRLVASLSGGSGSYYKVVKLSDGGLLVASVSTLNIAGPGDPYSEIRLTKIDSTGLILWNYDPNYGAGAFVTNILDMKNALAFDVVATDDGAVVSWMQDCDEFNRSCDVYAKKVLNDGTSGMTSTVGVEGQVWAENMGPNRANQNIYPSEVQVNSLDNDVYITYRCYNNSVPVSGVCARRMTSEADDTALSVATGWEGLVNVFDGEANNDFQSVVTSDGSLITKVSDYSNNYKFYKTNGDGSPAWNNSFDFDFDANKASIMLPTTTGGAVLLSTKDSRLIFREYDSDGNITKNNFYNYDGNEGYIDLNRFTVLDMSGELLFLWDQTMVDNDPGEDTHSIYAQKITPNGGDVFPEGNLVSNIYPEIDTATDEIAWDSFDWNADIPAGSSITLETRTGSFYPADVNLALNDTQDPNGPTMTSNSTFALTNSNPPPDSIELYPYYANDGVVPAVWGVDGAGWISNLDNPTAPTYLAVNLKQEKTVGRVVLNSLDLYLTDGDTPFFPTNYKIQTSSDGTTWTDQIVVPGDSDDDPDPNTIEHHFDPVQARYVRLSITSLPSYMLALPGQNPQSYNVVDITEFQVYSGPANPNSGWACDWGSCPKFDLSVVSNGQGTFPSNNDYITFNGVVSKVDASTSFNTQPRFDFTISDTGDVGYGVAISEAPIVITDTTTINDIVNDPNVVVGFLAFMTDPSFPFTTSFTVGQELNGQGYVGSYGKGNVGQSLEAGKNYYWSVMLVNDQQDINVLSLYNGWNGDGPSFVVTDPVDYGSIDLSSLPDSQYLQYKITMTKGSTPSLGEITVSGTHLSEPEPPTPPSNPPTYSPSPQAEEVSEEVTPEEQTLMQQLYDKLKGLEKRIAVLEGNVSPKVTTTTSITEILSSPIPDFPDGWGVEYPGGRSVWANQHRINIYQAYIDYLGRKPTLVEVDWWLQHEPDINKIRFYMIISPEYKRKWGM